MSPDPSVGRSERWFNDPLYHARVSVVRRWMERSQGAAPSELLSYAMDAIEDLDELESLTPIEGETAPSIAAEIDYAKAVLTPPSARGACEPA